MQGDNYANSAIHALQETLFTPTYTHLNLHTPTYMYTHLNLHTHMYTHLNLHTPTYTHLNLHTHIYTPQPTHTLEWNFNSVDLNTSFERFLSKLSNLDIGSTKFKLWLLKMFNYMYNLHPPHLINGAVLGHFSATIA